MGIPGVYRAATLIADIIGQLPWEAYRHRAGKFEKLDTPSLLEQPAPPDTRMTTFSGWAMDLVFHGNAFGIIVSRDSNGTPTAVAPVPAHLVYVRSFDGRIIYQVGTDEYSPHDVIHFKNWAPPGFLRGYGVLEAHLHGAGALDLAASLEKEAQTVSRHGVPTGVINVTNPDATAETLQAVKDGWLRSQADRTVAVLNATTEFQPLSWNPTETQLLEARKFSLLEIANIFGLPPRFVGASSGDSMTYSNSETESIDLLKFSLGGHIARFEQTLSALFPNGTTVKADLQALLRADTTVRYQAYQVGIQSGFLLKSEVREREDLPPVEGIDDPPEPPPAPEEPETETQQRASQLEAESPSLWRYWTHGEGLARWAKSAHPYTKLVSELRKEGIPEHMIHGLAANIYHAVFHKWPGEHHD